MLKGVIIHACFSGTHSTKYTEGPSVQHKKSEVSLQNQDVLVNIFFLFLTFSAVRTLPQNGRVVSQTIQGQSHFVSGCVD